MATATTNGISRRPRYAIVYERSPKPDETHVAR
jgi:hypothetical protein